MLLCLLTGPRCQTLRKLDTALMQELPGKIVFTIGDKLKTTRRGKQLASIELLAYPTDDSICVVSHLEQYIARTKPVRASEPRYQATYQLCQAAQASLQLHCREMGQTCSEGLRN